MTEISIVAPTRDRPHVLERLLTSVAAQSGVLAEVVIVDDASSTPIQLSESYDLPVRVIRQEVSGGCCQARNLGAAHARSNVILFLDDDVELLESDLLLRLLARIQSSNTIGVVALAELAPDLQWGLNVGPDDNPIEVARFYGFGFAFKRDCWDDVEGFFEPLGYYYDEFEMSMRVIDKNWRIVFDPALKVVHHRDPAGRNAVRNSRLISRNALLTAALRFPWWMIPPACCSQLARFAAKAWLDRPADLVGPFWVAYSAVNVALKNLNARKALRYSSLRRYRKLARSPEPLNAPVTDKEGATCLMS